MNTQVTTKDWVLLLFFGIVAPRLFYIDAAYTWAVWRVDPKFVKEFLGDTSE